jgi:hypothetical protein
MSTINHLEVVEDYFGKWILPVSLRFRQTDSMSAFLLAAMPSDIAANAAQFGATTVALPMGWFRMPRAPKSSI